MIITNNAYLYDGSFEGLLTVVFTIYDTKIEPDILQEEAFYQPNLEQQLFTISTDISKAERVKKGVLKKSGKQTWEKITKAFLSHEVEKELIIYRYIKLALKFGYHIHEMLSQDDIINLEQLIFSVDREFHRWIGFIRFSKTQDDFYYAAFKPKANMTPLLMPFFAERFADQAFILHDLKRNILGVYTLNDWYLVQTNNFKLPEYNVKEKQYEQIWKTFFKTVAIPERKNKDLQRNLMPNWYRSNMTEFKQP